MMRNILQMKKRRLNSIRQDGCEGSTGCDAQERWNAVRCGAVRESLIAGFKDEISGELWHWHGPSSCPEMDSNEIGQDSLESFANLIFLCWELAVLVSFIDEYDLEHGEV